MSVRYERTDLLNALHDIATEHGEIRMKHFGGEHPSRTTYLNRFGTLGDALDEAGLGEIGEYERCEQCGRLSAKLARHWREHCSYPTLSAEQKEILQGLLLGDGSVGKANASIYPQYQVSVISNRFLEWLSSRFGQLAGDVSQRNTASEMVARDQESGWNPAAKTKNYHDYYEVMFRPHPYYQELRDSWYTEDGIFYPDDLTLSSTMMKAWYVSDGTLTWGDTVARPVIVNCTQSDRRDEIKAMIEQTGFDVTLQVQHRASGTKVKYAVSGTNDKNESFLEWLGEPWPGYEYKWMIDDRERYDELKKSVGTRDGVDL